MSDRSPDVENPATGIAIRIEGGYTCFIQHARPFANVAIPRRLAARAVHQHDHRLLGATCPGGPALGRSRCPAISTGSPGFPFKKSSTLGVEDSMAISCITANCAFACAANAVESTAIAIAILPKNMFVLTFVFIH